MSNCCDVWYCDESGNPISSPVGVKPAGARSGPWATEEEVDCPPPPPPPPPITTDCSPENPIPSTLYLTLSNSSESYPMEYGADGWVYQGPITGCSTLAKLSVYCEETSFYFAPLNSGNNCIFSVIAQSLTSYSPFSLSVSFSVTELSGSGPCSCLGPMTGVVTE